MSSPTPSRPASPRRDPLAMAALLVALLALVFSLTGLGQADKSPTAAKLSKQIKQLNRKVSKLKVHCPISNAVDFGTWCLESSPHSIPPADVGKNDYFYATRVCAKEGGWLPTAAQLIGAAGKAPLQSTIDDDPGSSGAEEFPEATRGIKDKREMSSDLFTTTAGSEAAGSQGVTPGSKGNVAQGEPDPIPMPADPVPDTLNYVTVYDNHNQGGFAGGAPVGKAESFRCAYAKTSQTKPRISKTS
ncbi:MAG TPA: hypothetical protein VFI03_11070 [Solirubrobacterales bacterium]|nr:hypothetical protein [Solirubrobacterales bacterium]